MTICKEDGENGLEAANFTGVWKVPGYRGEEESAWGGVYGKYGGESGKCQVMGASGYG